MSGFQPQIEEARRKAAEAEDPSTTRLYEHHADLLSEVDGVLDAQRDLLERKNESLEALAGLVVSFYRKHGDDLDGEAKEDLSTIAVAAQQVIEQVEGESDPLAAGAVEGVDPPGESGDGAATDEDAVSGDPEE